VRRNETDTEKEARHMTRYSLKPVIRVGCAGLLAILSALAQDHAWSGRQLSEREWAVHQRLAVLPSYGVFDTIDFQVQGGTVTLSGQVVAEATSVKAERAVKRLDGVERVVNQIEVLPSSRRDEALRINMYRAIYEEQPRETYDFSVLRPIHIVVKDGWARLQGVVESQQDRADAYLRALKVTRHVSDNLRVAPDDSDSESDPVRP
jgi:hyperosmotically inducible protein